MAQNTLPNDEQVPGERAHGLAFLDQLTLFGPRDLDPQSAVGRSLPTRTTRPRTYDKALLRYVGYYRLVTLHQVIYRFFIYGGRPAAYGFKLVQRLCDEGWIDAAPLDSKLGAASRTVLSLTPLGWAILNAKPPKQTKSAMADALRTYRLQFAEMMLEREAEGWSLQPGSRAFATLQNWALAPYRGRMLNADERVIRQRLERTPAFRLPVNIISRNAGAEVRLVLPLRVGKSYSRTIDALPEFNFFPPLHFEMVASDLELLPKAEDYLRRWAQDKGLEVVAHSAAHFRSRPHPARYPGPIENRYALNGIREPRALT
jgi:hypothetical protein